MSLIMASPSSSEPRNYKFKVFSSFHGPDVRKTFLSHLREQFQGSGITMFDDEKIRRGGDLSPSLKRAIKESKISIVILSKKYASSSWCLDELVEIMKRKKAMKQIVMTVFYGVEPSDVRKQTGEFGKAFKETCTRKTGNAKKKWSKALTDVSNIAGEDFKKWDNEANMIKKIARDVSDKLNATPSRDFEDMVGLEAHLEKVQSLLHLDSKDEAMIFGISGPAGIGKTTIARALHSRLYDKFQRTCFMKLSGSDHSGLHDYGQQLRLQEQLLSEVLNQDGTRICHLGVLQQRLSDLRVLIILDEVNDVKQLKALAKETNWFGPGSRIVVTTENKDLLQQRGINNTYHVELPSEEEALEILCKYAFEQNYPPHGFKQLAAKITYLCGNLPLGLCVMGSSLFGKKQDEWECVMQRLETNPGREIDDVLRVSYERLHENDQMLFLHLAVFFNNIECDIVEAMFTDDGNWDVKNWLKVLVNKSLIEIYDSRSDYNTWVDKPFVGMHRLLQQVGRQAIRRQEPWKRQIIIDAHDICDILRYEKGTSNVSGISFDTSGISEVIVSDGAFKRMPNLRFLRVYKRKVDGNDRMHIPEEMEFPCRLRLLEWVAYPSKSLPPTFNPEYLVELYMPRSQLEKLWEGSKPLKNLKYMDLSWSKNLKEVPDLSNAINLEYLNLEYCESLVEIPSSCSHLHKLVKLDMNRCTNLQVIPVHMNLASLEEVDMSRCSRLRKIPVISTHIKYLCLSDNPVLEINKIPSSYWCRLECLSIRSSVKLKGLTHLPTTLTSLYLSNSDFKRIPDCIKDLYQLKQLYLDDCKRLTSLPELPHSLERLYAQDCESLETIFTPSCIPHARLSFTNCFKLDGETQRAIIQRSENMGKGVFLAEGSSLLPGREVPAEFYCRAKGNSLTIFLEAFVPMYLYRCMVCVVLCPKQEIQKRTYSSLLCRINGKDHEFSMEIDRHFRREHLYIFPSIYMDPSEAGTKIVFEISSERQDLDIIECGVKIQKRIKLRSTIDDDRTNGVLSHSEKVDQILTGETNGRSADEDNGKNHMCSHESGETSQESESESDDDEEDYKTEPGEASEEDDEGYANGDNQSVSRKRPRKTTDHQLEDYSNLLKYILLILLVLLLIIVLLIMSMRIFLLQGKSMLS